MVGVMSVVAIRVPSPIATDDLGTAGGGGGPHLSQILAITLSISLLAAVTGLCLCLWRRWSQKKHLMPGDDFEKSSGDFGPDGTVCTSSVALSECQQEWHDQQQQGREPAARMGMARDQARAAV